MKTYVLWIGYAENMNLRAFSSLEKLQEWAVEYEGEKRKEDDI